MNLQRLEEVGTPCDLTFQESHRAVDKKTFLDNLHLWAPDSSYRCYGHRGLSRVSPIPATRLVDQIFPPPIYPKMKYLSQWQAFFDEWLPPEGKHFPKQWVDLAMELFEKAVDGAQFLMFYDDFLQVDELFLSRAPVCTVRLEPILFSDNPNFIGNAVDFLQFLFQGIKNLNYSQEWAKHYNLDRSMLNRRFRNLRLMALNIWKQLRKTEYACWEYLLPLDYLQDNETPFIEVPMTRQGLMTYGAFLRITQPLHEALSCLFESAGIIWLNDYDKLTLEDTDGQMIFDERMDAFLSLEDIYDRDDIWFSMFLAKCFPQTHPSPYSWRTP